MYRQWGGTVRLCEAPERAQPQDNAHSGEGAVQCTDSRAGQYGSVRPLRGLNHRTMLIQVRELYSVQQWAGQYGSVRPLRGLNHRTMLIQVKELCTVQYKRWMGQYSSLDSTVHKRTMLT